MTEPNAPKPPRARPGPKPMAAISAADTLCALYRAAQDPARSGLRRLVSSALAVTAKAVEAAMALDEDRQANALAVFDAVDKAAVSP